MDGVLNVLKPRGPTSHDVVADIRRIFGQKRVGHTGTLDPIAEGVLVVCLGRATRLVQYLVGAGKEYRATMVLGAATDTQDSTGQVTATGDASHVTREMLIEAARSYTGEIEQVPPMVSAIKHHGKRLYELARRGEEVERQPRRVTIYSLDVLDFRPGETAEAELVVCCSSGTYIRTLCSDMGDKLGCGAHMKSLVRTRVGSFTIETSEPLPTLAAASGDTLGDYLIGMSEALSDMPAVTLEEPDAFAVTHGMVACVDTPCGSGELVKVLGPAGAMLAVGVVGDEGGGKTVKPKTVLVGPEG